ncbi:1-acylglycerol-3-phosphate O-acyltransferase [Cytospora mali]|uniref:1-acylglycerol-3-phosphate O-acyltransferase n=1 Tax=Cytospora mali TaxID=578113 RepID=A0A194UNH6_CYTMA|nr:1-acylglycerol-3-phosphate O-acyltransferase [Valsa mali var. pyri (nom. inval.)]
MYTRLLIISLAFVASALPGAVPTSKNNTCRDLQIPVAVSEERFIINATVNDNWDAASLTFNLTRRDSGMPDDPIPIAGTTSSAVESTYTIGATLCGTGGPMLVLTHGIIESKLYWQPNLTDSKDYNFVDAAVAAGYSVLNYDRIGVGSSSKVDALTDAQFQVEVAVLNYLTTHARETLGATKVALIGHSYGAYISAQSAASLGPAVDALVLTGFSGTFAYFGPFVAGAGFRVAKIQDPERWGDLDSGYLTSSDLYAETYVYFSEPYFERRVAEWTYEVASEPFAVGELPSLLATTIAYKNVTSPTLLLQGEFDVSACGGNCVGVLDSIKGNFSAAPVVETVDNLPAGHNLFLHKIAPKAFNIVFDFLGQQGF